MMSQVPRVCDQCAKLLTGYLATIWMDEILCETCFDQVKQEHPEITEWLAILLQPIYLISYCDNQIESSLN